ncbi:MAG: hypothetical protein JW828_13710 [Sedimentisphaerales bacterium]|nr:hypothetical protein [Sedimentisphaerales bacterium]
MDALFLDTSTQIARQWHAASERNELRQQLQDKTLYCSHYVKCQYKATLLNSMIYLYNLLLHYKDMSMALLEAGVYENRNIAGGSLTVGVQNRINAIGNWVRYLRLTYEEQVWFLEDCIEDGWETLFHGNIEEPLIDRTACLLGNGAPIRGDSGAYEPIKITCTKRESHPCMIAGFWEDHAVDLEILASMNIEKIKAEPRDIEELDRVKKAAQDIRSEKGCQGNVCTKGLSDAIICLESTHCPEPVAVHSINKKHFRPLCEVLGLESEP